ncbi:hypothetical protein GGX14DRAFT_427743 [Mycena pura]|uniref:Uncharacterized protein n=1 Tax=Mycena pura TaxID=153505 RepID=A0AAD6YME2_9AGAR|nr:hypothetical protein GGX14DRAFT_427743 [Mycena pura]
MPAVPQFHPPSSRLAQALEAASVLLESLLYGAFVILFLTNCYLRLSHRDRLWCNAVVLPMLAIFAMCTMHWVISVICFFSAFFNSGAIAALPNIPANRLQDVSVVIITATVLLVDGVIIHRLWVIWNRNIFVAALPLILWLGILVDGVATLYMVFRGLMLAAVASRGWTIANWAFSAATNIYCTGLSAWRIWRTCRVAEDTKAKPFMSVLIVLVESAAIWMAWNTFTAVTIQKDSPLQHIASQLTVSIAGIVNMLIHIRVGFLLRALPEDGTTNPQLAMTNYASMVGVSIVPEVGTDLPCLPPAPSITNKVRGVSGLRGG